jgi:hypothetical protein
MPQDQSRCSARSSRLRGISTLSPEAATVSIDNQAFLLEQKDLAIGYFPQCNKEQVCKCGS